MSDRPSARVAIGDTYTRVRGGGYGRDAWIARITGPDPKWGIGAKLLPTRHLRPFGVRSVWLDRVRCRGTRHLRVAELLRRLDEPKSRVVRLWATIRCRPCVADARRGQ